MFSLKKHWQLIFLGLWVTLVLHIVGCATYEGIKDKVKHGVNVMEQTVKNVDSELCKKATNEKCKTHH